MSKEDAGASTSNTAKKGMRYRHPRGWGELISSSGLSKILEAAAFPNGLPEDLEASVTLQAASDGVSSDSDHSGASNSLLRLYQIKSNSQEITVPACLVFSPSMTSVLARRLGRVLLEVVPRSKVTPEYQHHPFLPKPHPQIPPISLPGLLNCGLFSRSRPLSAVLSMYHQLASITSRPSVIMVTTLLSARMDALTDKHMCRLDPVPRRPMSCIMPFRPAPTSLPISL